MITKTRDLVVKYNTVLLLLALAWALLGSLLGFAPIVGSLLLLVLLALSLWGLVSTGKTVEWVIAAVLTLWAGWGLIRLLTGG